MWWQGYDDAGLVAGQAPPEDLRAIGRKADTIFSSTLRRACETADAVAVTLAVPPDLRDTFRFTPGQYLTLRREFAGEELRRSYSICAGLDEGVLRIGIKRVAGGVFSTWAVEQLRPGDTLFRDVPVHFPPIPSFSPEHFAVARGTDPSKHKQFR